MITLSINHLIKRKHMNYYRKILIIIQYSTPTTDHLKEVKSIDDQKKSKPLIKFYDRDDEIWWYYNEKGDIEKFVDELEDKINECQNEDDKTGFSSK